MASILMNIEVGLDLACLVARDMPRLLTRDEVFYLAV